MRSNPVFLEYFCEKCETWEQVINLARKVYKDTFCPGGYITIHGSHLFKKEFYDKKLSEQIER